MQTSAQKKRIKIFVSSTFNDMHAERDIIMHRVQPEVTRILDAKNICVQFIDLRWGVNTQDVEENERENVVLRECISEIQSSRPFFIGLLGRRYGWIPPSDRWEQVLTNMTDEESEYIRSQSSTPKSVTELEILFGALMNHNYLRRSLFCFRSDKVYELMDETARSRYIDSNEEAYNKTIELKQKIRNCYYNTGYESNLYEYSCLWDGNRLSSLDGFANFLIDSIVKEVVLYECSSEVESHKNEYEKAFQENVRMVEKFTSIFCGRELLLKKLNSRCCLTESKPLIIASHAGFGKTALLSRLWQILSEDPSFIPLIHFTSGDLCNRRPETMLKKWLSEAGLNCSQRFGLSQDVSFEELSFYFGRQAEKLPLDKKLVLLVDGLDEMDKPEEWIDFSWLPKGVIFIATADQSWFPLSIEQMNYEKQILPGISPDESRMVVEQNLTLAGKSLPLAVMMSMLELNLHNYRCSSSPLWCKMMVRRLTQFNDNDYTEIRKRPESDEALKIQNYLLTIVNTADAHPEPLFISLLDHAGSFFESKFAITLIKITGASEYGLRERDLQEICGKEWDSLYFSSFIHWLGDLMDVNDQSGIVRFAYQGFRYIARLPHEQMTPYFARALNYFGSMHDQEPYDFVANREIPFLAIRTGRSDLAGYLWLQNDNDLPEQTVSALICLLNTEQENTLNWCKNALKTSPDTTLALINEVAEKLNRIGDHDLSFALLKFALSCLDEFGTLEQTDEYTLNQTRLLTAEHLINHDPENAGVMLQFLLKTCMEKERNETRYLPLMVKAGYLYAGINMQKGIHEDAKWLADFCVQNQERWIVHEHHFDAKSALNLHRYYLRLLNICEKHYPEQYDPIKRHFNLNFSGNPWLFAKYEQIEEQLHEAGLLLLCGQDFPGNLLLAQSLKTTDELKHNATENILFYSAWVRAELCRCQLTDDHPFHPEMWLEVIKYLEEFITTESVDAAIRSLLFLHKGDPETYSPDYVLEQLKTFNPDLLSESNNTSGHATLFQLYSLYKVEMDNYLPKLTAEESVSIAEELLLMRRDNRGAEYFLGRYESVRPEHTDATNPIEIRYHLLRSLAGIMNSDFGYLFDYQKQLSACLNNVTTAESMLAVNDVFRVRQYIVQCSTNTPLNNVEFAYALIQNALKLVNAHKNNFAYNLRLQLCFYNYCSVVEINMMPLLRSGKRDEAHRLIEQMELQLRMMERMPFENRLSLAAHCLACSVFMEYYEEAGLVQEALYYGKKNEFALYELLQISPDDWETRRRYAAAIDEAGRLFYTYFDDHKEAARCSEMALPIFRQLYDENPVEIIKEDLLVAILHAMQPLYLSGNYRKALNLVEELPFMQLRDGASAERKHNIASIFDSMADNYEALKEYDKQEEYLGKASLVISQLCKEQPQNELFLRDFVQNGIRMCLFLWDKRNKRKQALSLMEEIEKTILIALQLQPDSIKTNHLYLEYLIRHVQMLFIQGDFELATKKTNEFIQRSVSEVEAKIPNSMPILWHGLHRWFDVTLQMEMLPIAQELLAMELKLKKEFVEKKLIREEDADWDSILQRVSQMDQMGK